MPLKKHQNDDEELVRQEEQRHRVTKEPATVPIECIMPEEIIRVDFGRDHKGLAVVETMRGTFHNVRPDKIPGVHRHREL
jgi:hypothetical protein